MNFFHDHMLIILFIVLLVLFILWWFTIFNKETHPLDKYAKLGYYKPCIYNKDNCIDKLNEIRKNKSSYGPGDICVVTVSIGDRDFSRITKKRMKKYCDLYGYDMKYFTKSIDNNYGMMWQKCLATNKVLNIKNNNGDYKYKVVVWFDDDIYITNMKHRLEDFLEINPDKDIIFPRDIQKYNYSHYINSGNYILKNTKISRDFMRDTLNGMDNLFGGYFKYGLNHEQSINTYLYFSKKKYANSIEVLPYGVFQSFHIENFRIIYDKMIYYINYNQINGQWKYGDYCIHFASMDSKQRYNLCRRIDMYDETVINKTISYPNKYSITRGDWYNYY